MIIYEKVYGNMTTVFHRTSISDLVNKIYTSGFKPGSGDMYGRGFYATYELSSQIDSQNDNNMSNTYGNIIVKFAVPISTFFVFDYDEFKKSPNFNKLGKPKENEFLKAQFEFFKIDDSNFNYERINLGSSNTALWCTEHIRNFKKLCEGIIFTGKHDGKVLCAYNTKLIYPLSYSINEGKTWEKVEKNLDYLKKVSKIKNRFIPDLAIKPEELGIREYSFDEKGFLNVEEDVSLNSPHLNKIPFKFGKINGDFDCSFCNLETLRGCPTDILGNFSCSNNKLKTLKGGPKLVKGHYGCHTNKLISLEGAPPTIAKSFDCSKNKLNSLKYSPKTVGEGFDCSNNELTSLESTPKKINGHFDCCHNNLSTLKGGPQIVDGMYECASNNLISLDGCATLVEGDFYCANNPELEGKYTQDTYPGKIKGYYID